MKTFCFKLYKSKRNKKLHSQINITGLIYNHCIALHKKYYKIFGKYLHKFRLSKHLTKLKKLKKFSYLKDIGSQAVQDVVERIDRSYQLFFRNLKRKIRCSPPNFKKVKNYKSFTLKQAGWKLYEDTHTIFIRGQKYRYFQSRKISGKIKTVTIKRDSLGDFFVYFVVDKKGWDSNLCKRPNKTSHSLEARSLIAQSAGENPSGVCQIFFVTDAENFKVETRTGKSVGFDFGLKNFLTSSDGNRIESPLFFEQNSKLIAKAHRNLSRKLKGSNNRRKAKLNLARIYRKSANQRKDFHFKLARKLCIEYEKICIEDLNLKSMQRLWGKKISDLAFGEFVNILKYQAAKFGVEVLEVDRYFASSQLCSQCGEKNSEVKDLKIRSWRCPKCGEHHDRDINAAKNILNFGLGHRPMQETE